MTTKNAFPQIISSPAQNLFCLAGAAHLLQQKVKGLMLWLWNLRETTLSWALSPLLWKFSLQAVFQRFPRFPTTSATLFSITTAHDPFSCGKYLLHHKRREVKNFFGYCEVPWSFGSWSMCLQTFKTRFWSRDTHACAMCPFWFIRETGKYSEKVSNLWCSWWSIYLSAQSC